MKNYSILFVDDEEIIVQGFKVLLAAEGYEVHTAATGEEAIEIFTTHCIDLVVTDILLPGLDGFALLKKIKMLRAEVPVLVITGFGDLPSAIRALRMGAEDYLLKPISRIDEFLLRISHSLNKKEVAVALRRYQEIFSATTDMMLMVSADYTSMIVNEAFAKTIQKSRAEIAGSSMATLFGADFFEQKIKKPLELCFQGEAVRHQDLLVFGTAPPRLMDFSYSPIFSTDLQVSSAVITLRDISEINRLNSELKESENRLHLALDISSDGVWDRDIVTGKTYYGKNWAEFLGYTLDEIKARKIKFTDLLHPEDKEKTMQLIQEHLEGKTERYVAEFRLQTKSGKWEWILARGKLVSIDGGKNQPQRFIGTHTSITRRKEAELALQEYNDNLEEIVAHRTQQLAEKNKDLAQYNAALSLLLAKREEDKKVMAEQMVTNIKNLVSPYIEKMKKHSTSDQRAWLTIIETNLNDIMSPFLRRVSTKYMQFTPTEIQVANLIKVGKTTKEIAEIMNLSPLTINNHRKHIRRKSGIANKKVNLQNTLASFSES